MDPGKVIIFVAAFLLLLLLGRKLSSMGETHHPVQYPPPPEPLPVSPMDGKENFDDEDDKPRAPAVVGAEIPFPISLPPVECNQDGRYNRPHFLNYFFREIDLVSGPTDKRCFCDQLVVETRDPDDGHSWNYVYTVTTPAGLQKVMDTEHLPSLYIDTQTVIVSAWDMKVILNTIVQEIMKIYQEPTERPSEDTLRAGETG